MSHCTRRLFTHLEQKKIYLQKGFQKHEKMFKDCINILPYEAAILYICKMFSGRSHLKIMKNTSFSLSGYHLHWKQNIYECVCIYTYYMSFHIQMCIFICIFVCIQLCSVSHWSAFSTHTCIQLVKCFGLRPFFLHSIYQVALTK